MIALLVALLAASAGTASGESAGAWQETLDRVVPAVVVLRVAAPEAFDGGAAGVSTATGFVVDAERGLILTNRHVVRPGPVVAEAVFLDHEEVELRAVYRDPVHDFGFYRFDPADVRFMDLVELELAPERAQVGAEIRVIGNDAGDKLSILSGTIARLDHAAPHYGRSGYNDFNTFYLQAASGASGGSSGSPVIDIDGKVVALNAAGRRRAASSFFLPLDRVVRALDLLRRNEPIARGTLQVVLRHRAYDELRRLGLGAETEASMRARSPHATGGLAVAEIVPEGPADGLLEVGDVIVEVAGAPVDSFVPVEAALDERVGATLAVVIERAGERHALELRVDDLQRAIPREYLALGQTLVHPVSIHAARNRNIPLRGLMLASPGYMFSRAGVPAGALIVGVDGSPVDSLDDLQRALEAVPDGGAASVRYVRPDRSHRAGVAIVHVPRRWFTLRRCARDDALGKWPCVEAPPPPLAPPPEATSVQLEVEGSRAVRRLASSLVLVDFEIPYRIDGVYDGRFQGAGLVVDRERGLVVADRDTIPIALGDVWLTFGGKLRIPGEVVFLHPEHNFGFIRYDPARLGATPVRAAQLRSGELGVGRSVELVALTRRAHIVSRRTRVARRDPVRFPATYPPRYRERNLELIRFEDDLASIGGVVADRRGRVYALYASFARGSARANDSFLAGLAAHWVIEALALQQRGQSQWRTLDVGFDPLTLAQARERGLSNEQAERIEEHAAARARVLSVRRISAISPASGVLKEGDLLLAVDAETVTRFREVETAARASEVVLDVLRDGELERFEVETDVVSGRGTDEALLFAGAILQAPHPAVVRQYPASQPGVYLSWVFFGSPASQYELPTTRRIVAVDGVPTPDLASFVECVRGREDGSALRVAMLSLEGRSEVATLKLDLEHWPTTLLRRGDAGWQRIPIDLSGPPE